MKKLTAVLAPLALAGCICGMLRADDSSPPQTASADAADAYIWRIEHTAAVAKDADASGVQAVMAARELFHGKDPQVEIDYFTKMLYETRLRPVQREIRIILAELYKGQGQDDKALDQLQQLMMDQ